MSVILTKTKGNGVLWFYLCILNIHHNDKLNLFTLVLLIIFWIMFNIQ